MLILRKRRRINIYTIWRRDLWLPNIVVEILLTSKLKTVNIRLSIVILRIMLDQVYKEVLIKIYIIVLSCIIKAYFHQYFSRLRKSRKRIAVELLLLVEVVIVEHHPLVTHISQAIMAMGLILQLWTLQWTK